MASAIAKAMAFHKRLGGVYIMVDCRCLGTQLLYITPSIWYSLQGSPTKFGNAPSGFINTLFKGFSYVQKYAIYSFTNAVYTIHYVIDIFRILIKRAVIFTLAATWMEHKQYTQTVYD
jgi:hypothetical protein